MKKTSEQIDLQKITPVTEAFANTLFSDPDTRRNLIGPELAPGNFQRWLYSEANRAIITHNGRPIGVATLAGVPPRCFFGYALAPEYRGHGLAKFCLAAIEAHAGSLGFRTITTNVASNNLASIRSLEKRDFRRFQWFEKNITLKIERAKLEDIQAVADIHDRFLKQSNQSGFFLRACNRKNLTIAISNPNEIFLVAKTNGEIIGYLLAQKGFPEVPLEGKLNSIFVPKPNHIHINQVATIKPGTGKALYRHLIQNYPQTQLSAYVAEEPPNEKSKRFHLKIGFQKTCRFTADSFQGIQNYKSGLLVRESTNI